MILKQLGFLYYFFLSIFLSFPLKPIFTNVFWLKMTQSATTSTENPFPFTVWGSRDIQYARISAVIVINPVDSSLPYF